MLHSAGDYCYTTTLPPRQEACLASVQRECHPTYIISSHTCVFPWGVHVFQGTESTCFWRCLHWRTVIRNTKRVESSCQISMESQGIKQVQRLLQQVLEEESRRQKLWFRTTLSPQLWMLQCHRPFANVTYANILSTSEASNPRKHRMAEQNMDMNTHAFQSVLTQEDKILL